MKTTPNTDPPIIVCLGPAGTNAHEAACAYFADACHLDVEPTFLGSSFEALREVAIRQDGREIFACAPIENSSAGLVEDTRNFWVNMLDSASAARCQVRVVGELCLPIPHCLAGRADSLNVPPAIVASHPQALAQCAGHIREAGLVPVPASSTAAAARDLAALSGPSDKTVICSRFAVERYGLTVLAGDFHDQPGNATRFHLVSRAERAPDPTGEDRMAILIELSNSPGALHHATGMFAAHSVNLSTQKDVPLGSGRYAHYFEAECHEDDPRGSRVLTCLRTLALNGRMVLLGSYPRAARPQEGGAR